MAWGTASGEHFLASNPPTGGDYVRAWNPISHGATGNGVALDDAAFSGWPSTHPLYLPASYTFLISSPLAPGVNQAHIFGDGIASQIKCNTAGVDVIQLTTNSSFRLQDFRVVAGATAGHCINATAVQASIAKIEGVYCMQSNPAKSCLTMVGGDGFVLRDSRLDHLGSARSVPILNFSNATGDCNGNTFEGLWIQDYSNNASAYQVVIETTNASAGVQTTLRNIIFENPVAGAVKLGAQYNAMIDNVGFWDLGATTTADLIQLTTGGGLGCYNCKITRVYRPTGTLGGGLYDINNNVGVYTHIYDLGYSGSTTLAVNFANVGANGANYCLLERCPKVAVTGWNNTRVVGAAAGSTATMTADPTGVPGTPYVGSYRVTTGGTGIAAGLIGSIRIGMLANVSPASASVDEMNLAAKQANLYISGITVNANYVQIDVSCTNVPAGTLDMEIRVNPGVTWMGPN